MHLSTRLIDRRQTRTIAINRLIINSARQTSVLQEKMATKLISPINNYFIGPIRIPMISRDTICITAMAILTHAYY